MLFEVVQQHREDAFLPERLRTRQQKGVRFAPCRDRSDQDHRAVEGQQRRDAEQASLAGLRQTTQAREQVDQGVGRGGARQGVQHERSRSQHAGQQGRDRQLLVGGGVWKPDQRHQCPDAGERDGMQRGPAHGARGGQGGLLESPLPPVRQPEDRDQHHGGPPDPQRSGCGRRKGADHQAGAAEVASHRERRQPDDAAQMCRSQLRGLAIVGRVQSPDLEAQGGRGLRMFGRHEGRGALPKVALSGTSRRAPNPSYRRLGGRLESGFRVPREPCASNQVGIFPAYPRFRSRGPGLPWR